MPGDDRPWHMRRRRFLSSIGVAGASLVVSGCQGSDEAGAPGTEDGPTEGGNGARTTAEEPTVEERISSADARLSEAADELDAATDDVGVSGGASGEFDVEPVEERLDEARTELEAARPDATRDQRETIEALAGAADFMEEFARVIVELREAMAAFEEADRRIEREEWEAAAAPLERADDRTSAAKVRLDEARTTFEGIDTGQLGGVSGVEARELERTLEEMDALLAALDELITGMREVARGIVPYEAGAEAVEAEDWGRAAEEFGVAVERFTAAQEQFERAEDSAPPDFREGVSALVCQWSALGEATEEFERGAEAAEGGDPDRARSAFEAADEAIQRADRCEEV